MHILYQGKNKTYFCYRNLIFLFFRSLWAQRVLWNKKLLFWKFWRLYKEIFIWPVHPCIQNFTAELSPAAPQDPQWEHSLLHSAGIEPRTILFHIAYTERLVYEWESFFSLPNYRTTIPCLDVNYAWPQGWAYLELTPKNIYVSIKNTKQLHCVFILGTFILESRNKNYSAPIGSMGNYLLSTESFM